MRKMTLIRLHSVPELPLGAPLGGPRSQTHVPVTVHTQRLDLGGLLLLILRAEGPEQRPSGWRPCRSSRGPNSSSRGPGLHSPAGRHLPHALPRRQLPASAAPGAPAASLPPAAVSRPFLKRPLNLRAS